MDAESDAAKRGFASICDVGEKRIRQAGKKVFSVAGGYLNACFDDHVTEETVKAIAGQHPFYAVFRDSGMASDSVMTNFEQIFETYSPKTQRKVLWQGRKEKRIVYSQFGSRVPDFCRQHW